MTFYYFKTYVVDYSWHNEKNEIFHIEIFHEKNEKFQVIFFIFFS